MENTTVCPHCEKKFGPEDIAEFIKRRDLRERKKMAWQEFGTAHAKDLKKIKIVLGVFNYSCVMIILGALGVVVLGITNDSWYTWAVYYHIVNLLPVFIVGPLLLIGFSPLAHQRTKRKLFEKFKKNREVLRGYQDTFC